MNKLKKYGFAAILAVLCGFSGAAFAQSVTLPAITTLSDTDAFQDVVNGQPNAQNQYATGKSLRGYIFGGGAYGTSSIHTGTPVLTSCITGGGTIVGTDYSFILTGGSTAATSCVATFSVAYNATPNCVVSSQTAPGTTTPSYAVSTTAVTITQASNSSEVYNVICVARNGG